MKYNVNLAGRKEPNVADKTVFFLLHYLRYILVITQFVVLLVFFFRFTVDETIIDLKDALGQKKAIIEVVQPILAEAKRINDQAKESDAIIDEQEMLMASIKYILSIFPESLVLDRMEYTEGKILLSGTALNPRHLQLFYNRLKQESKFTSVELKNVKRDFGGYAFEFELDTGLVKTKPKLKR